MKLLRTRLIPLLLLLPGIGLSQLDQSEIVRQGAPDFGAVFGNWGQLQYYRPYGLSGILVDDWRDLGLAHPLTGEPMNTDRMGWLPQGSSLGLWEQTYSSLVSPADTSSPSLLVNYRQGDYVFKDFNLWYHNALGSKLRYAWFSKLKSQTRTLNFSAYDEQQHLLQIDGDLEEGQVRLDLAYKHQINPLFVFERDSTGVDFLSKDSVKIGSDRWEGQVSWSNRDSTGAGTEVFGRVQTGDWTWYREAERSLNSLWFLDHQFKLMDFGSLKLRVGYQVDQLGKKKFSRPLASIMLPSITKGPVTIDLGVNHMGETTPNIGASFSRGKLGLHYQTRGIVRDHMLLDIHESGLIHSVSAGIERPRSNYSISGWSGELNNITADGFEAKVGFRMPWDMTLDLAASTVNSDTSEWLLTRQQLEWTLEQELLLLDGSLNTHLKLWGRHMFEPTVGVLDIQGLNAQTLSGYTNPQSVHLLNYTISVEVSSLIMAFTDTDILQDPLWESNFSVPWESSYSIMSNQYRESRFRYFSVIWVFNN